MKKRNGNSKKSTKTFDILFIPTANSGVVFWRIENFLNEMVRYADVMSLPFKYNQQMVSNWELGFTNPKRGIPLTRNLMGMINRADVIVFQLFRTLHGVGFLKTAKDIIKSNGKKKLIFSEIDDNFMNVNPEIMGRMSYFPGSIPDVAGKKQLELSDGVIVSTNNLKKELSKYNKNIHVMPNCINFGLWDNLISRKHNGKIRIGYAGGAGHTKDLLVLDRVIDQILAKHGNKVEFVFLGCIPKFLRHRKGVKPIDRHYPINKYPQGLADMNLDIGLAPLNDNEFNRAKSNIRWLEYSAISIPTVVSNVEPFKKSVKNGETGFICKHEGHWFKHIDRLIRDKELRERIGRNANDYIRKHYNVVKVAKHYVDTLRGEYTK